MYVIEIFPVIFELLDFHLSAQVLSALLQVQVLLNAASGGLENF